MILPLVLAAAISYGCKCELVGNYWKVAAWTKSSEGPQTGKIIFMGESRTKALKACDKWMQKKEREIKEQQKKDARPYHGLPQCAHPKPKKK